MPVTTRPLDLEDRAQYDDLVKIYDDGPLWMRRDEDGKGFVENYMRSCDTVWGGWFNGRVIGAVGTRSTKKGIQLIGLCVRDATRGRGVARQMLTSILPRLKERVFIEVRQQASTDRLFDGLGFSKETLKQEGGGITWVRWSREAF